MPPRRVEGVEREGSPFSQRVLVVGATGASVERKDGCATMYLTLRGKIERERERGRVEGERKKEKETDEGRQKGEGERRSRKERKRDVL